MPDQLQSHAYYALSDREVIESLNSNAEVGLTTDEVACRYICYTSGACFKLQLLN